MPLISIIIPTFNRALTLKKTLDSIIPQLAQEDIEVIVVDNGSTDDTKSICTDYIGKFAGKLRYQFDDEPGLLTGRHVGAFLASGRILCFLDDDVQLDPSYIISVKDAFNNPDIHLATGPSIPDFEEKQPEWLRYFWVSTNNGRFCTWLSLIDFGSKKKLVNPNFVWGLNFCILKSTFIKLGGFHPDNIPKHLQALQGDGETGLTMKAEAENIKALYHPKLKVYHFISKERLTEEYFHKRAYYQGICNSFTQLRSEFYLKDGLQKQILLNFKIWNKWISLKKRLLMPAKIKEMQQRLNQQELMGYKFHQEKFHAEEKIKHWVLKENYFDYKLPFK